jgi:hypothetical protein
VVMNPAWWPDANLLEGVGRDDECRLQGYRALAFSVTCV